MPKAPSPSQDKAPNISGPVAANVYWSAIPTFRTIALSGRPVCLRLSSTGERLAIRYVLFLTRTRSALLGFLRLFFASAPEQDDAQQERHDEWDSRDSDNKTGTGVPWRRSRVRIL